MTHAYKPKWSDFYEEELGPYLPLSSGQQTIPISGVLPSGESGGFDNIQYHRSRAEAIGAKGSGINFPYPYPNTTTQNKYKTNGNSYTESWWETSGILKTYPPDDGILLDENRESGIFHYNFSKGRFSNGEDVKSSQIEDFTIFNDYIHHELVSFGIVTIPYISTFKVSINWNPYG